MEKERSYSGLHENSITKQWTRTSAAYIHKSPSVGDLLQSENSYQTDIVMHKNSRNCL